MHKRLVGFFLLLVTICAIWFGLLLNKVAKDDRYVGDYHCISYTPSKSWREAIGLKITEGAVSADLALLSKHTKCIRTYQARGIYREIPRIAETYGMVVRQGIWLDNNLENNQSELESLKYILAQSKNIESIVVGNEVLLFNRLPISEYEEYLKEVKTFTKIPIVWADIYSSFLNKEYKEILPLVDIIGIHIFPYWEGVGVEGAKTSTVRSLHMVKVELASTTLAMSIGMPKIDVYEIGWPSAGYNFGHAQPSIDNQVSYLTQVNDNYLLEGSNIIEAFDQPQKMFSVNNEGWTGGHWGLFDVWGFPKKTANTMYIFWLSLIIFLIYVWLIYLYDIKITEAFKKYALFRFLFIGSILINIVLGIGLYGLISGYVLFTASGLTMFLLQVLTTIVILRICYQTYISICINSIGKKEGRESLVDTNDLIEEMIVAVHIPCAGEDPERLCKTIQSCLKQTYPVKEILVGINNCSIEKYYSLQNLFKDNNKIKIIDLGVCQGAKGEALNKLLKHTSKDVTHIGYIDADYIVMPDWISLAFESLRRQSSQAVLFPQNYEKQDPENMSLIASAAQLEFDLCFDIDTAYRSQYNAILLHGTLCIIDKKILEKVGGWPQNNICEDSELGMRILAQGGNIVFEPVAVGAGIAPTNLVSFYKQHRRWAHGGMVTLRRMLLEYIFKSSSQLSVGQIFSYILSWLPWILQVFLPVFFIAGMLGTLYLNYDPNLIPPIQILLFPSLVFVISTILGVSIIKNLYGKQYPLNYVFKSIMLFAAQTQVISDGVLSGLLGLKRPFEVTTKNNNIAKLFQIGNKRGVGHDLKYIWGFIKTNMSFYSLMVISLTIFQVIFLIVMNRVQEASIMLWTTFLILVAVPSFSELILIGLLFKESKESR